MSLSTLIIIFAVSGSILTLFTGLVLKINKVTVISWLQHFCGVWFIFSGFVKAVDPLGTAYKMHQYFAEFESTFSESGLKFIAGVFPLLSEYAVGFSLFMIILEMLLGLFLIMGWYPKFTKWGFLLMLLFFTVLTGFTFLTGYVPDGVNFFSFGKWETYDAIRMKVTDCGCFGDFIHLEPKVTFTKDVFLLIPGFIFLLKSDLFHKWIPERANIITGFVTIALFFYCLNNYYFDIPGIDFRPFKEGVNIREKKFAEEKAASEVVITAFKLKEKATTKVITLSADVYNATMNSYPVEKWEVIDQIKTEPGVKRSKISDYSIYDFEDNDVANDLLSYKGKSIMISAYELKIISMNEIKEMVPDSLFVLDTLTLANGQIKTTRSFKGLGQKEITKRIFNWDEDYLSVYRTKIVPMLKAASQDGVKCYMICNSYADAIKDFKVKIGYDFDIYTADDLVLKTIIRSNPGITLWNDGTIMKHYHYKKLPPYAELKARFGL